MRILILPSAANEQEKWLPVSREITWLVFFFFLLYLYLVLLVCSKMYVLIVLTKREPKMIIA